MPQVVAQIETIVVPSFFKFLSQERIQKELYLEWYSKGGNSLGLNVLKDNDGNEKQIIASFNAVNNKDNGTTIYIGCEKPPASMPYWLAAIIARYEMLIYQWLEKPEDTSTTSIEVKYVFA